MKELARPPLTTLTERRAREARPPRSAIDCEGGRCARSALEDFCRSRCSAMTAERNCMMSTSLPQ